MKIKNIANVVLLTVILSVPSTVPAAPAAIHLAILADENAAKAGDMLTAELSSKENLILLERAEMEKVLREQKLSVSGLAQKDFLRVGQILGADGLLTLDLSKVDTNTLLSARLIAVKQGVVLDLMQARWPLEDAAQWAKIAAKHFTPFFPKLNVLPKDAIPISILNLRAAVASSESTRLERELTLLLIDRLTREPEIFVLERRRMDALSSEKELSKTEDVPFWNGSYLVEGIIDKGGFSKEQVTISARVVPPGGGAPVQIEVAGKRNDLPPLIDELAKKLLQSLQKSSSVPEWKPTEEAGGVLI